MTTQADYELTVQTTHNEDSLQTYVSTLRMFILNEIGSGLRDVYSSRVKPVFIKHNGRDPNNEHEVRKIMMKDPYCQTWSSMMRSCQEMIWDSIIPSIERAQPNLNKLASKLSSEGKGKLNLDPSLEIPNYVKACDIHLMPGNYNTDRGGFDVTQGALYDRGVYVYADGNAGPWGDSIGRSLAKHLMLRFPKFNPSKILDIGCTVGHNLLPFMDTYPAAELNAIDVSAPVLRYAHSRAEALGYPINFHQMNGENMQFPDNSFDLVFSIITFHETSIVAMKNILKECNRVLRPGGMMIHMELPRTDNMDPFDAFYLDWDSYYNNEPFYQSWTSIDLKEAYKSAGFSSEKYFEVITPDVYVASQEDFNRAADVDISKENYHRGRLGEGVHWTGWGSWK